MELLDWLLSERYVTFKPQYDEIARRTFLNSRGNLKVDVHGLLSSNRVHVTQPTEFHRHPVGEVIDAMPMASEIYRRASVSDLSGLVAKWHQWHVDNLESMVNYPTGSSFARRLLEQQRVEKKRVAWFLTSVPIRGHTIISDTEKVVILDGSSGYFVGLGIAAWKKRVCIITSNGPLFCEYLCNPAFANALGGFYLIGGRADHTTGGSFEDHAYHAYETAIQDKPEATVVIIPVRGILPDVGPYGMEDQTRMLKKVIIDLSVGKQARRKVRQLVFIADYSKHRKSDCDKYGLPILDGRSEWRELLETNHDRISLVTAPPPGMETLFECAPPIHPAMRTTISSLKSDAAPSSLQIEYNQVAREFGERFQDEIGRTNFHEVESISERCRERAMLTAEVAAPNPYYPTACRQTEAPDVACATPLV